VAAATKRPGAWYREHCAESRISKSADGGRTWQGGRGGLSDQPLNTAFEAMCLEDWEESFSVLAATATGEVWCSDDGGERWREVLTGLAPVSKGPHHVAFATAA